MTKIVEATREEAEAAGMHQAKYIPADWPVLIEEWGVETVLWVEQKAYYFDLQTVTALHALARTIVDAARSRGEEVDQINADGTRTAFRGW